jgi:hypothetical protein
MTEPARCAAHLRSGERCRSVAVEGEFCAYHDRAADDVGEDAVRAGQHVRRRQQDSAVARVPVDPRLEPPEVTARNGSAGDGVVTPSEVRPRLAAAAAANLPDLERVLLDAATGATRQTWTTITCKHCLRLYARSSGT